jgi:hypothetical protein
MNPSEPSPADIAMVAEAIGQPAVVPAPVATPPAPVAPVVATPVTAEQPAPVATPVAETDPFASLFATEPIAPVEPQTAQPIEPMTPQPQQPVEPTQPVAQAPVAQDDTYQTFDEYMAETLKGVPTAPTMPDVSKIDPNDEEGIKNFFDELVNTAVSKSQAEISRKDAITTRERQLWDASFEKYGSLRTNKKLRDMVHDIRMGYFRRGQAITPTQAADKLLESMGHQYKQGIADSAVVTTIQDVQPTGGNSGAPIPTTLDKDNVLESIQTGGETALANYLDQEVKAGRM